MCERREYDVRNREPLHLGGDVVFCFSVLGRFRDADFAQARCNLLRERLLMEISQRDQFDLESRREVFVEVINPCLAASTDWCDPKRRGDG